MNFLEILKALIPVAEPLVLQEFEMVAKPELDKLVSKVGSPDWGVVAAALEKAGISIAESEIPKLLKL